MYANGWFLCAVLAVLTLVSASDDGSIQILVEHSFGGQSEFTKRGDVELTRSPVGDQTAEYVPGQWTKNDQDALLDAAKNGRMYKIRAPIRFSADSISGDAFVMSSVPACSLVESQLTDRIHLAIDSSRQRVLSISSLPLASSPDDCQSIDITVDAFNTTLRLVDVVEGPIPETQAYLQKVEREKQERQRGEQGDSRSFLAKYWMYIVPVVIVLMLSSAMNPDAQGGGR